jgi:hypothetical protein
VDWGHLPNWNTLVFKADKQTPHPDGLGVNANAGMAGLVPAWKLAQLLHSDDLNMQRKELDETIRELFAKDPSLA